MRILGLFFALCLMAKTAYSQNIGDTIVVQGFEYKSSTRDTIISFPTNPAIRFEKVIMRYAMRCKNALVSTGSNRNLGCGEWDYSCNTYVENPSMADSIISTVNRYQITPNTNTTGMYSTVPTWTAQQTIQNRVLLNSIITEDTASIGLSANTDTSFINSRAGGGKSYVLYTAAELLAAGLTAGNIDAISLNSNASNVLIKKFRLSLKQTTLTNLDQIDTSIFNHFQEVYFQDYNFTNGWNRIQFHNSFNWDGSSNLIIETNYKGNSNNNPLILSSTAGINTITSSNDFALNLFPNNYVEANSYQGISGNNDRTVTAWIKTTGSGEITTWGTNNSTEKQSFWVNGSGKLRLEINGAYAVGTKVVNDGQWHHVGFTFSGYNMYNVKFYVDGKWDYSSSVSTKAMNTQLSYPFQISKGFHNRYFSGQMDDIRVWDTALSQTDIKHWMHRKLFASHINTSNVHPQISHLDLAYDIKNTNAVIEDISTNSNDALFNVAPSFKSFEGVEIFKNFESNTMRPNIRFMQGTYNLTISADTLLDTTINSPYTVIENTIYPRPGTTSSDSIGSTLSNYYDQYNIILDVNGNQISQALSSSVVSLQNVVLDYYQRNPSNVEIMSFVTPYGIGLDLGVDGKAWYFDVTDYLPVLQGNRRLSMTRGGQWQEEMDIQFLFIVGTPPADVKRFQQIWKVDSRNYTDIIANKYFAPRSVPIDTSARIFKVRSAITGHGQQGEFIARNHYIDINNGAKIYNRAVWKTCSKNPVYPQGGTWIYDRAGWCPGMATDVAEYDISNFVSGDSVLIEYGVSTASGDSRYIVSNQLVSYGNPNFTSDARIIEISRPTNDTEFGRRNPSCYNPIVRIQNTGSNLMTAASIQIQVNGGAPITHNWTGSLNFMESTTVLIPVSQAFWSTASVGLNTFKATIMSVNGGADQYAFNNSMQSNFEMPDDLPSRFSIVFKTNLVNETSYTLKDESGTLLFQKSNLATNHTYVDTFLYAPGCYRLDVLDAGNDGLSFFANNSGTGYFRIADANGTILKNFNPDFGAGIEYYFTVGNTTGLNELHEEIDLTLYPNPTDNVIYLKSSLNITSWELTNNLGQAVLNGIFANSKNIHSIDVNSVETGVYYLKIVTENKTIIKKIIKQ
ncbi:MAG: T9SS type A sorting domain-containing protein [Flavobacteriales bacterium]|nr:T9SS type A sorting domain-containing protein [Flavobacteriales bacterium]